MNHQPTGCEKQPFFMHKPMIGCAVCLKSDNPGPKFMIQRSPFFIHHTFERRISNFQYRIAIDGTIPVSRLSDKAQTVTDIRNSNSFS
jgi:hypothetical protein